MRLLSLEINGFRGFPRHCTFDLNADAIIVVGANGSGKTSFFDAILWALTGRIPRLKSDDSRLISMYSETGQARVALCVNDPSSDLPLTVIRTFDGKESRISVETRQGTYKGPTAEGRLIDLVWPDAATASDPREALPHVLTQSIYLQQDLIREFLEASSDQDRFSVVSELVGAGRVTDLQSTLEREKKAWTTVTNQLLSELHAPRQRLDMIDGRLLELTSRTIQAHPAIGQAEWAQWWKEIETFNMAVSVNGPASVEAPSAIDRAIKQLDAVRLSKERRVQALRVVQSDVGRLSAQPLPEITALKNRVNILRDQIEGLMKAVNDEQAHLALIRHQQASLMEKTEQLRTLAALALKHLEERCPVCAQGYDKEATRLRLERIAKTENGSVPVVTESNKLTVFLAELATKEEEAATSERSLRSAEQAANERRLTEQSLAKRLADLGIVAVDENSCSIALLEAISEANTMIMRIIELQRKGEAIALRLAQSSAMASIDELRLEGEKLRHLISEKQKTIEARGNTGEQAQCVIDGLREATSGVVQKRLQEIDPILQGIYSRIDMHPAFRMVAFLTSSFRGKGLLSTIVRDPVEGKEADLPHVVLSSSQMNALAVSVFLSLNLGIPKPPLSVAILDDPLQSLDDVNLLGLVDLLRRTKDRRQLFVSTHDEHFSNLLSRKLRPGSERERTIVIELESWSRRGPNVLIREIKSDPVMFRLAASTAG